MSDLRILLVDDSPDDVAFIEHCLRRATARRYILAHEESGAAGLAQIGREPPDCLLLDYNLPDMYGLEILAAVAADGGEPPFAVVMLTGSGDDGIAVAALRGGADDYLIKGEITADGLRRAIENAVEKCRLRKERHAAIAERKRVEQALRESDERFRLALEHAPILVFTQDRDLRYTWIHKVVDGLAPSEVLGRADHDLVPEQYAEPVEAIKRQVIASGEPMRSIVAFPISSGEGHFDLSVEPLRDDQGAIIGVICVAIDVTAQRELDRARETFLATISHELRNPLAALNGYAQLLQRRGTYNERAVSAIVNQAARMRTLVDDMLDVTRLSIGKMDLNPAECDVAALARAAVERVRVAGTPHRVTFEAPETPVMGWWDATRIAQVLDNLLSNAAKYSPDGGEIAVRVTAGATEARVEVSDQGIGIPADVIPQLFDRFYRVGEARVEGLGLGLHITRELIHAHGGRIEVESERGQGSRFTVILPYDGIGASSAPRGAASDPARPTTTPRSSGRPRTPTGPGC
jgi:PAS domain S-box-containing protein